MYIQQILSLIASFLLYTGDTLECKNKEYVCYFVWAWGREKKKNNKSAVFSEFTPPQVERHCVCVYAKAIRQ